LYPGDNKFAECTGLFRKLPFDGIRLIGYGNEETVKVPSFSVLKPLTEYLQRKEKENDIYF